MHVPRALTTPTASLIPLMLTFLLTSASGDERGRGGGDRRGGGATTPSMDLAPTGRHPSLQEEVGGSELCDTARLHCTVRVGCQRALSNLMDGCRSLLSGKEARCRPACQHALVALLSTEDRAGVAFTHCDCEGQQDCRERRQRVQVCQHHVLRAMALLQARDSVLSCGLARRVCEADTSCLAALQYYRHHCGKLFAGTRCTARCRNSVLILYRQPKAEKLRSCRCEGDEDYDCPSLLNNTQRLCLQRHRHHLHHHNQSHHHHHQHRHVHEEDEWARFRQPGRRQEGSVSITQSYTSGQASLVSSALLCVVVVSVCGGFGVQW